MVFFSSNANGIEGSGSCSSSNHPRMVGLQSLPGVVVAQAGHGMQLKDVACRHSQLEDLPDDS